MRAAAALERAGIRLDGGRPFDIKLHDPSALRAYATQGLLGALQAYVDGLWDAERLDEVAFRFLSTNTDVMQSGWRHALWRTAVGVIANVQAGRRGFEISRHYDLGNDLFEAMLDPRMVYSCAYWDNATTLADAQERKLDLIARKLHLQPGMRVLDIGGGWGGFAKFAAERYGVRVVATTISVAQAEHARASCRGLPVEIRLQDYRETPATERYDAAVSIGMFEHVGHKNYRRYFEVVKRCLGPDALFLLHTIGGRTSQTSYDPWFERNIFPNSHIPSARQITNATEGLFLIEDWHDIGTHYARTLLAWYDNVDRAWPTLRARYGERFYRTGRCYLLASAGAFRARYLHTGQLVLAGTERLDGYRASR